MKVGFSFEFGKRVVHYDVKSACAVFAKVFAELDETIREVNDDL